MKQTWIGSSGINYSLEVYDLGQVFEDLPGIYILGKELKNLRIDGLAVGETESLQHSLTNERVKTLVRHGAAGATHVATLVVRHRDERLRFVADLTGRLGA